MLYFFAKSDNKTKWIGKTFIEMAKDERLIYEMELGLAESEVNLDAGNKKLKSGTIVLAVALLFGLILVWEAFF